MSQESQETPHAFVTKRSRAFYDARLRAYTTAVGLAYGMRVDHQTRSRWTELMMLGRAGDDFIDDGIEADELDNSTQIARATTFIEHLKNDDFSELYPSISRTELGPALFAEYVEQVSRLMTVSLRAKKEYSLTRHMALRAVEGAVTAKLVTMLGNEQLQNSKHYQRFSKHLRYAGAISTLCDSAWEFRDDTKKNEIALEYSPINHLRVVKSALLSSIALSRQALKKR